MRNISADGSNWFCRSSSYGNEPAKATQIQDFRNLIRAFHKAVIPAILDVVYNHFGDSEHLQNIDSEYSFRRNDDGSFRNFTGCGNDLRTESHMTRK
jgi:pullulanase/glycogen debranching enzyme